MERPSATTLALLALVAAVLLAAHLAATHGTGQLSDPEKSRVAVSPAAALALSPNLAWAGLFHFSWRHLVYNLCLFAFAFPLATRTASPWATLATSAAISVAAVLALPALVIQPLAGLGVAYAQVAMEQPLVGASIGIYAIAGAALASMPRRAAAWLATAGVTAEVVAAFLGTRPFVFAFHLTGLALGYAVRVAVPWAKERTASVFMRPARQSSSRPSRAFSGRSGQSTHLGSASQQATSRSRGESGGQGIGLGSAMLLEDEPAPRRLRPRHVADAVDDGVEV